MMKNIRGATLITFFFIGMISSSARATELTAGMSAPSFTATMSDGKTFSMDGRKGKWTVLYFYPKDNSPGCTKQAEGFRDYADQIRALGAEVYGISQDDIASHESFSESLRLNFPLIADPDGAVSEKFGADGFFGFSKRWTFIIDPDLKIVFVDRDVDPGNDARDVLAELKKLVKKRPSQ